MGGPYACSPHTRGWTGDRQLGSGLDRDCSPHTRGWTAALTILTAHLALFPAHAGMDRENQGREFHG